jgi:predicted nucleotidyltransferase component of viral defense system
VKPLTTRLAEARSRLRLPAEVVDRDYVISWVLAGIAGSKSLGSALVFKGGTALKKCYFGDYRFSEDLDFTGLDGAPTRDALEKAVQDACHLATELAKEYAPIEIIPSRYVERDPHPAGQEAFKLSIRLPWHGTFRLRLIIEVTVDEPLLWPHVRRPLIHGFEEQLDSTVLTYSVEEIVAEKLRALLQQSRKLRERNWIRSRARDYYDLWRILGEFGSTLAVDDFGVRLREKCAVRSVEFKSPDDFFDPRVLEHTAATWQQSLGSLVPNLPPYEQVLNELKPAIEDLIDWTE